MLAADGLTRPELAERYDITPRALDHLTQEPDWPAPVGKRGRHQIWDPAQTDKAMAARRTRATPAAIAALGRKLVTVQEIAGAYCLEDVTVRGYAHRGMFGEPDEVRGATKLWRADRVAEAMARRRKRERPKGS